MVESDDDTGLSQTGVLQFMQANREDVVQNHLHERKNSFEESLFNIPTAEDDPLRRKKQQEKSSRSKSPKHGKKDKDAAAEEEARKRSEKRLKDAMSASRQAAAFFLTIPALCLALDASVWYRLFLWLEKYSLHVPVSVIVVGGGVAFVWSATDRFAL